MSLSGYKILFEITKDEEFSRLPVSFKLIDEGRSEIMVLFSDLCIHIKHEYGNSYSVDFKTAEGYSLFNGINSEYSYHILSSIVGPHRYYNTFKSFLTYRNFPIIVGCLIKLSKELSFADVDMLSSQLNSVSIDNDKMEIDDVSNRLKSVSLSHADIDMC